MNVHPIDGNVQTISRREACVQRMDRRIRRYCMPVSVVCAAIVQPFPRETAEMFEISSDRSYSLTGLFIS